MKYRCVIASTSRQMLDQLICQKITSMNEICLPVVKACSYAHMSCRIRSYSGFEQYLAISHNQTNGTQSWHNAAHQLDNLPNLFQVISQPVAVLYTILCLVRACKENSKFTLYQTAHHGQKIATLV